MELDDEMIDQLAIDVDTEIMRWLVTFEIHPLNLIAIMLARMTWMAKQAGVEEDYIKLLESPKEAIQRIETTEKKILH